jgi:hypothetical protein
VERFILFKFSTIIFASRLLVGVVYVVALVIATRRERPAVDMPLAA